MKVRIFYGWYIVVAGMVMATFNASIFAYGWSAFVNHITLTFTAWTMTQISFASSLRSMETGVFNPLWGLVVDRISPKRLMLFGVISTALGMLCLSQTRNLAMFYGGFLIMGLGSSLTMGILPQTVIAWWFRKDIGKASGLFYMGAGLGGVSVPLIVWLLNKYEWQNTLLYGSVVFAAVGIPISFVMRSRPEDYSLVPDGRIDGRGKGKNKTGSDFGTSVKEALKSRAFWHIAVVTLFQNATMSTIMLYAIPYLTKSGMDEKKASTVISLYTFVSLFGRIPFGAVSDYLRKSWVLAASVTLQIAGLVLFWRLNGQTPFWFIILFAVVYGIGLSGVMALRAPMLSEYFGVRNFGAIFGLTSIFITIGQMVSQPLAGWIWDTHHDYRIWWISLACFGVLALISILTIPRPRTDTSPEPAAGAGLEVSGRKP